MDEEKIEEIEETPMGDDTIRTYFPNAKIITYKDLNNYDSLEELLPNNKSYCFMLIEDSPNKGHWVCLNKINDTYEFFDSYGGKPDSQQNFNPKQVNQQLGQSGRKLSELYLKDGLKVKYNPYKYQEVSADIQTCGRHCCMRVKTMLDGKDLDAYYKFMRDLKDSMGKNYDEIVSFFINRQ